MRRYKKTRPRRLLWKLGQAVCTLLIVYVFAQSSRQEGRAVPENTHFVINSSRSHKVQLASRDQHVKSISEVGLILAIEVYHGLCNRLRAYASAAALAKKVGREVILIWRPDIHANFTISDIFKSWGATYTTEKDIVGELESSSFGVDVYDYLDPAQKNSVVNCRSKRHIYVRSSFILQSAPQVTDDEMNEVLRDLEYNPAVLALIKQHQDQLGSAPFLGAHIRMLSDQRKDIPGIASQPHESPIGLDRANQATKYRKSCHFNYFFPKVDRLSQSNQGLENIFVASDSPQAIGALRARYGARVVSTQDSISALCRGTGRRGAFCAQVALSEFVTLSKASYILTSSWSSASEIVVRLSESEHESGCRSLIHEPLGIELFWKSFTSQL